MPINIYFKDDIENKEIAWLCDNDWELPRQVDALENWLVENREKLAKGSYVADIGYIQRKNANGGAVITLTTMEIMLSLGMELYLSEYSD